MAAISPRDAASALAYGQMTGRTSPVVGWDAAQEACGWPVATDEACLGRLLDARPYLTFERPV
jgi:hypothetical protein